jgi:hypothetical protein
MAQPGDCAHNKLTTIQATQLSRKVHLLLSEIPAPAWQADIVMDRTAWNKMLRSIDTN